MQRNDCQIVVLDGYTLNPGDLSWAGLDALGNLEVYQRTETDKIIERAKTAEIIFTNKTPLRKNMLSQLHNLKFIGVLATGYDVIDIKAAKSKNIVVSNVPSYGTNSVAQMVIAQLLAFCHRVEHHSKAVKSGRWADCPDYCFWDYPQVELSGKIMGIIGFGRIGHQIGRIAAAMGMKIQAYDEYKHDVNDISNFVWADLEHLLRTSDVISVNCPLTPETEGFINKDSLNVMKPSVILLNASRGGLVVEDDLAEALNSGRIAGAGIDVLSSEPPSQGNILLSSNNTIITPHIAWATREARNRLMDIAIENLQAFFAGTPQNVVT